MLSGANCDGVAQVVGMKRGKRHSRSFENDWGRQQDGGDWLRGMVFVAVFDSGTGTGTWFGGLACASEGFPGLEGCARLQGVWVHVFHAA